MERLVVSFVLGALVIFLCLYGFYYFKYKTESAWPKHDDPAIVGYVPNEETAIKVAEALWLPLYGSNIYNHKPFEATLVDSVWIVKGTLAEGLRGGVPYAEILGKNCKVLRITHTK